MHTSIYYIDRRSLWSQLLQVMKEMNWHLNVDYDDKNETYTLQSNLGKGLTWRNYVHASNTGNDFRTELQLKHIVMINRHPGELHKTNVSSRRLLCTSITQRVLTHCTHITEWNRYNTSYRRSSRLLLSVPFGKSDQFIAFFRFFFTLKQSLHIWKLLCRIYFRVSFCRVHNILFHFPASDILLPRH